MENKPFKHGEYTVWKNDSGLFHRLDGPAVIFGGFTQWWFNGHDVDDIVKPWAKELGINLYNLSEEDKILIQTKWENYGK